MSHIHIPDGVLPWWLAIIGWAAALLLVSVAIRFASEEGPRRRVPLVGAVSALMLVGMSSEIVPIAYHINLTVVAGILLGPWLSIIAAFVVDIMLALLGHGGVTVVGLNTLVISTEMLAGWALFHLAIRALGRGRAGWASAFATLVALATSAAILVAIVALGGSPAATRESGALDPATLTFSNPFAEGVLANRLVAGGETEPAEKPGEQLPIARFAIIIFALGSVGWVLEAAVSALIVRFVARVRPGLIFEGAPAQPIRAPLGDEGVRR